MSTFILNKNYTKSDVQKTLEGILISYTKTLKYLKIWTCYMHQIFIANKFVINKTERNVDLLIKYPLPLLNKPLQLKTNKLKPRSYPYKNAFKKHPIARFIKNDKTNKKTYIEDVTTKKDNKNEMI